MATPSLLGLLHSAYITVERMNIRQFGIRFRGPRLFNSLPTNIQNTKTEYFLV